MSDRITISEGFYDEEEVMIDDRDLFRSLIVKCGDLQLFISAEYVTEIINGHTITSMPLLPSYIKGIINLRGQILPIVDLRTVLKVDDSTFNDKTCIVVVSVDDMSIGMIVDAVLHVEDIDNDAIQAIPTRTHSKLLSGIIHLNDESVAFGFDPATLTRLEEMTIND